MTAQPLSELAATLTRLTDPGVPDTELLRRFAEARDEAAFELLVWRHGGMVLGTCRRVLGRSPDAEDAFQATFLALARKAGAVRRGESLPGWLHRVALRAALRLKAGRRESVPLPEVAAPSEPLPDDTAAVLDEEIGRLPDKLRVAFVLCELEGRTDAEAAEVLGCPKGTILSRLSRAREQLRSRLTRRGLAVATTGAIVGQPAVLTAARVAALARAGVSFVTGRVEGAASVQSVAVAQGVLRSLAAGALKPVAAVLTVAVLAAVGAALAGREPAQDAPPVAPVMPPVFVAAPVPIGPPAVFPNVKLAITDHGVAHVDEVRFSPDGQWLVTAGYRSNGVKPISAVAVWDARTGEHVHTFTKPDGVGTALDFSRDGKLFATANPGDGTVTLWETGTWKERVSVPHELATDIQFSPSGKLLVTRSCTYAQALPSSEVRVWHTDSGKGVFDVAHKADEALWSVAFSPDEKTLAVGTERGVVQLIDTRTGKVRSEIKTPEATLTQAAFSLRGDKLLTWAPGEAKAPVRIWDTATGKEVGKLEGEAAIQSATFSPDGKHVVTLRHIKALTSTIACLWDPTTGKKLAAIVLSENNVIDVRFLSFSPDGKLLVLCGTEEERNEPKLIVRPITAVCSVPDGKELLRLPEMKNVVFNHNGTTAALLKPGNEADEVTVRGVTDLLKRK